VGHCGGWRQTGDGDGDNKILAPNGYCIMPKVSIDDISKTISPFFFLLFLFFFYVV